MLEGQGLRACAYHLVGVAAATVAPSAFGIRRTAGRPSLRSLSGVDAHRNRRTDMYTPDGTEFDSDYAWNQNFGDGYQNNDNKNNSGRCRAVRK